MAESESKGEREEVPVPVRKQEQKVEPELPEGALEPRKQREIPPRWRTY